MMTDMVHIQAFAFPSMYYRPSIMWPKSYFSSFNTVKETTFPSRDPGWYFSFWYVGTGTSVYR